MKTIRTTLRQEGPSCNLDDAGDPIPPKYRLEYRIETAEPGVWRTISETEARQLLAAGQAVLI
jgi:hypothetical protein